MWEWLIEQTQHLCHRDFLSSNPTDTKSNRYKIQLIQNPTDTQSNRYSIQSTSSLAMEEGTHLCSRSMGCGNTCPGHEVHFLNTFCGTIHKGLETFYLTSHSSSPLPIFDGNLQPCQCCNAMDDDVDEITGLKRRMWTGMMMMMMQSGRLGTNQ